MDEYSESTNRTCTGANLHQPEFQVLLYLGRCDNNEKVLANGLQTKEVTDIYRSGIMSWKIFSVKRYIAFQRFCWCKFASVRSSRVERVSPVKRDIANNWNVFIMDQTIVEKKGKKSGGPIPYKSIPNALYPCQLYLLSRSLYSEINRITCSAACKKKTHDSLERNLARKKENEENPMRFSSEWLGPQGWKVYGTERA